MKKLTCILALALLLTEVASAQNKSLKMGENNLFMPKGAISVGLQSSYFDLSGSDASIMLFLDQLNASGTYFSIAPYFSYSYRDNRSVGVKFKYANSTGGIAGFQANLPGSDVEFTVNDINANSTSFMGEIFHRSYMGLDTKGRFGLFVDLALQYSNSRTAFGNGSKLNGEYTKTHNLKAAVRPGLEVFVMNNVSSIFSIGIGGISYSNSKNYKDATCVGSKNESKARFMPDLTDISMGIAIYF